GPRRSIARSPAHARRTSTGVDALNWAPGSARCDLPPVHDSSWRWPLTALAFKTTIDNPGRFRKSRHVGVHLGLTPGKYASGEVDYNGRITRCGDAFAREHLFEAAHSLMVNTRRWCSLKAWGIRIAKRSSMKNALVAVAR